MTRRASACAASACLDEASCHERYRNLLAQASEGVFIADEQGRCLVANPAGARLLGFSMRRIVGKALLDRIVDLDPRRLETLRRQLRAGRTIRIEKRFLRKDGSTFPGELSALRLSDGTTQCILRDVTERLRAEQEARVATDRLQTIFENSPMGVFFVRVSPDGKLHSDAINPFVERITGLARAKARGLPMEDVFSLTLSTSVEGHYRRCCATGAPVDFEWSGLVAGREMAVQVFLFPVRDPEGRIHRIDGFIHDITDRKTATVALRETEEKFAKIFRFSPDAIVVSEYATGRVVEINDSMLRILGRTREQTLGRTLVEIGVWPDEAARAHLLAALRERGTVRDLEMRWHAAGGDRVSLLAAERIELRGVSCILSLVSDVTELRRAERERVLAAERERRAKEDFTRRLIESQEAERRRIAGELHDSIGQDLLLITNRLQLALASAVVPPPLREELRGIGTLATQAVAEVRRISHALRPPQLDHLGLTRALRAMLDSVASAAGLRLTQRIEDIDGVFRPDAEANLYRILQEGLNNILRHAQARQVEVVLEHDVHVARLILADDGRGFAMPAPEAIGLGLRNIAERVRILGGKLRIDSSPGSGARLEIEVPLPLET